MGFNLKNYEEVKDRIERFLKDFPDGRIVTEIKELSEDYQTCFFISKIYKNHEEQEKGLPLATGHAYEQMGTSNVNKTSHIENCETSAIGRALANINYIKGKNRASEEEMEKVERHKKLNSLKGSDRWPMDDRIYLRNLIQKMPKSDERKEKLEYLASKGPINIWDDDTLDDLKLWYETREKPEKEEE